MERENLVLNRVCQRLERFIKDGSFSDTDLFDRAYRLGLEHALQMLNEASYD